MTVSTIQCYSVNSSILYENVPVNLDDQPSYGSDKLFSNLTRPKRVVPVLAAIGAAAGVTGIVGGGVAIGKTAQGERCRDYGCHKGYCWAWCGITHDHGEWCYTTKTYSQSFKYVQCSSDSECNGCWHCAGSCTL